MKLSERKEIAARKLGTSVNEILAYKDYGDYVAVVIPSGQKFIITIEELEVSVAGLADGEGQGENSGEESDDRDDVIANPGGYDRAKLRVVAIGLNIEGAAEMNKRPLVKAINSWKSSMGPIAEAK